jgi:hypothetical protein
MNQSADTQWDNIKKKNHDNIKYARKPHPFPRHKQSERNLGGVIGVNDAPKVLHRGSLIYQLKYNSIARGQTARRNLEVYKRELLWGSSLNTGVQLEILYKTLSTGLVQGSRAGVLYINLYFIDILFLIYPSHTEKKSNRKI